MMTSTDDKRAQLAARIRRRDLVVAPGVFDLISAKLADEAGFAALYMTGYGVAASYTGLPDAGLIGYAEMADRARAIASATATPLIADADTGYGGLLNVRHTVRGYEAAGVAAIQIEDQEFPKKCGHTPGRRVIPIADMVRKIQVAVDARSSADFLIVARTDARTSLGLDDALTRAEAYQRAGADVIFVESPESEQEFETIGQRIDAPLLANMVEAGYSPLLSAEKLRQFGFAVAIYPGSGFTRAAAALKSTYQFLAEHGSTIDLDVARMPSDDMHRLVGFEDVWAFDAQWDERAADAE